MTRTLPTRRLRAGLAAVVTAVALAACSGGLGSVTGSTPPASTSGSASVTSSVSASGDSSLQSFYGQKLVWTGCGGGFQCGKLSVPLDYADPSGETIRIAVIRLKARDQVHKLGSLVMNPGGPGGSGVNYARGARGVVDASVRAKYDIVGFDPRGVAASAPVHCLDDRQLDRFMATDATPDTAAEVTVSEQLAQQFANSCEAKSPTLYAHIGTQDAARDVDVLRAALGDDKLNWLGFSYGTMLGATYADLFPTRVGRMVLDGAIDPSLSNVALIHGQAKGFELALHRFVQDCDRKSDCPLPRGEQAGIDRILAFFAGLDAKPLATMDRQRPLTQALAQNAVLFYLYFPSLGDWDSLRFGLQSAFDGDGSVLLSMLDERLSRNEAGHYTDNSSAAIYAVNALDRPDRPDAAQSAALAAQWTKEAPVFGGFIAWGILPYYYWASRRRASRTRSTPPAPRRSWSWARPTTPPRPTRGRRRWPGSSRMASCSPASVTATPDTPRAAPARTRPSTGS